MRTRKIHFKPQARVDLLEIWHYIANDSVAAADKVNDKIELAIRGLAEMPGKGHTRRDVKDESYRFWSVYSYVIAYRYDASTLTVVRVVHGARDFRSIFGD
jgi:plasmid stabilization system protein ParE